MFKCVRAIGYVPYWCHYLTFIGRGDGRRYRQEGKANWATNAVRGCVSNLWTRSVKYLDFTETSGQFPVVSVVPKLAFKARKYLFSNPSKKFDFWSHPVKTSHADLPAPPPRVEPRHTFSRVRPKCIATFALSSFRSRVKLPQLKNQHFQEASYC